MAEPAFSSRTRAAALRPGSELGERVGEPANRERPARNVMLADSLHRGASLLPCPSRSSSAQPGSSPSNGRPCGSCARPGRSLPEYREIRKTHTLFEVCQEPELCAEVTLQPVRRHDVDAAVMFADIMLPLLGMGVDVELVENVGPVIAEPIRTRRRRRAADDARSGGVGPVHPRRGPDRAPRASPRPGRDRLLRRPLHRRRLPDRGQAEPRVPPGEAADVRASPPSGTR